VFESVALGSARALYSAYCVHNSPDINALQLPLLVNRRRLLERLQTIVGAKTEIDPDVTDFVQVFGVVVSARFRLLLICVTLVVQDLAHEFVTSAVFNGCLLVRDPLHFLRISELPMLCAECCTATCDAQQARHRNSNEIDAKDIIPHIERHWGVSCEAHKVDLSKK
jgi:hypothetical protein